MKYDEIDKHKGKFIVFCILIAIPPLIFRFNHPHMTETELFLNFFKAYAEFFNR